MEAKRDETPSDRLGRELEDEDGPPDAFDSQDFSTIHRHSPVQSEDSRRIHIVGTGSVGKLVAHALRGIANPPPITLVFHRYQLLAAWEKSKKEITISDEGHMINRSGFEAELLPQVRREHGVGLKPGQPSVYDLDTPLRPHEAVQQLQQEHEEPSSTGEEASSRRKEAGDYAISEEPIRNLIVTTKAALTIPALLPIKHRLSSDSTICFLQNGMGVIDDVNKEIFPDEQSRPNYMQGIITHGVNIPPEAAARDPFFAVHAGHGTISLGLLPRAGAKKSIVPSVRDADKQDAQSELWAKSSRYLLRTLTRTPILCAVGFAPTELLQLQLEKLAVNSILNPLTVLLDARNGSILYNFAMTRTMRLMLAETSLVIRSLPELKNTPNVNTRFSAARLETLVVSVANTTKDNISSTLADVRAGRKTEIEYINGYIVRRGEEMGIKCVVNYAIMQTVLGKQMMVQREMRDYVPGDARGEDLNQGL